MHPITPFRFRPRPPAVWPTPRHLSLLLGLTLGLATPAAAGAAPERVERLLAPGAATGDTGYASQWLGTLRQTALPWAEHEQWGWIYLAGDSPTEAWIHAGPLGWIWVGQATRPYFYRLDSASWQYAFGSDAPGWYYDFAMRGAWWAGAVPHAFTVRVHRGLWQAESTLRAAVAEVILANKYPSKTGTNRKWDTVGASDWTSGFWPGCLWLMYDFTEDDYWRDQARFWTADIEGQKTNATTHDLGFMFGCSFGQGYRLTGDPAYRDILVTAAQSLDSRFSATVGAIRSWSWGRWDDGNNFTVIADNMMNLELLLWASTQPGGPIVGFNHARTHALTTRAQHLRADGGSYHCVVFDQRDGKILEKVTHQGYADSSTWARGQAWLIHGFTSTVAEIDEIEILRGARATADYFLAHLPPDHVPFWDFQAPNQPNAPRDTSAAAIAASGLIRLSQIVGGAEGETYWQGALAILAALLSEQYQDGQTSAILNHGTANQPAGSSDTGLIYGDYYFLESLLRYLETIRD